MFKMYSIYDKKAKTYSNPNFFPNEAVALRQFGEMCNDPQYPLVKYPNDYQIVSLGTFDEEAGKLFAPKKTTILCQVKALIRAKEKHG